MVIIVGESVGAQMLGEGLGLGTQPSDDDDEPPDLPLLPDE